LIIKKEEGKLKMARKEVDGSINRPGGKPKSTKKPEGKSIYQPSGNSKKKPVPKVDDVVSRQKAARKKYESQKSAKSSVAYQQAQAGQFTKGAAKAAGAAKIIAEHTVVKGDTLSGIAKKYYGSGSKPYWELIQKANSDLIKDANLIYPGQVFKIPVLPAGMKK
jgi:nucleoid-associated protein YgaU